MRIELAARQPFSLRSVIHSHGWPQLLPFHWERESDDLVRVHRLSTGRVVASAVFTRRTSGSASMSAISLTAAEPVELEAALDWMFGLDMDFGPFYDLARSEPKLASVEPHARGRVLRSATLWEDTVKTILTTNTAWSGTIRMIAALVTLYGDPLPDAPAMQAFPTPQRLAVVDAEELRTVARLGYRAPYIRELAEAIASGRLDLEALKHERSADGRSAQAAAGHQGRRRLCGRQPADDPGSLRLHPGQLVGDEPGIEGVVRRPAGRPEGGRGGLRALGQWKGLVYFFWDWDQQEVDMTNATVTTLAKHSSFSPSCLRPCWPVAYRPRQPCNHRRSPKAPTAATVPVAGDRDRHDRSRDRNRYAVARSSDTPAAAAANQRAGDHRRLPLRPDPLGRADATTCQLQLRRAGPDHRAARHRSRSGDRPADLATGDHRDRHVAAAADGWTRSAVCRARRSSARWSAPRRSRTPPTWAGARLWDVLALAGLPEEISSIRLVGADGYGAWIPVSLAQADDSLLAYEWQGEPLPILHGFPLRGVFPESPGYMWVKWLVRIEIQ